MRELTPIPGWEGKYSITENGHVWSHIHNRWRKLCASRGGYLYFRVHGAEKQLWVHRVMALVFSGPIPEGMVVDHINRNNQDNRKENIRIVTRAENQWNRKRDSKNTSGYAGVVKHRDRWHAKMMVKGRRISFGVFTDPKLAHEAYLKGVEMHRNGIGINAA